MLQCSSESYTRQSSQCPPQPVSSIHGLDRNSLNAGKLVEQTMSQESEGTGAAGLVVSLCLVLGCGVQAPTIMVGGFNLGA